jgi:hypothetical protein
MKNAGGARRLDRRFTFALEVEDDASYLKSGMAKKAFSGKWLRGKVKIVVTI